MPKNKIILGDGKDREIKNKSIAPDKKVEEILPGSGNLPEIELKDQKSIELPLDEIIWGNDYSIIKELTKEQLNERRLFVRVLFMRDIRCFEVYGNPDESAIKLKEPIDFSITDISVGGIGIICERGIETGTILGYEIVLDEMPYKIKCEVVYCFKSENKYRAGLKILRNDKDFIKHLKIVIARISLRNQYT